LSRSTEASGEAGFTLIEVLVALAIVATVLSSIGGLIASAARGSRSVQSRATVLNVARSVLNTMPERQQLVPGSAAGILDGISWTMTVSPIFEIADGTHKDAMWLPHVVAISVKSPSGNLLELTSIRLHRRSGGYGANKSQSTQ
jgi:general secretion pathway protein I